jgi:quinol monooxygenase YgiN
VISKYVTYKVKSTELATVTAAIKTFMHIMHFSSAEAAEQHSKSDYTNEFVEVLYPRCDVTPVFTDITPVNGL